MALSTRAKEVIQKGLASRRYGKELADIIDGNAATGQAGTGTLAAGTLVVPATITAASKIQITMRDPGAGAIAAFAALDAPVAQRVVGVTGLGGQFTVNAIDNTKATIATAVCTFDWEVRG